MVKQTPGVLYLAGPARTVSARLSGFRPPAVPHLVVAALEGKGDRTVFTRDFHAIGCVARRFAAGMLIGRAAFRPRVPGSFHPDAPDNSDVRHEWLTRIVASLGQGVFGAKIGLGEFTTLCLPKPGQWGYTRLIHNMLAVCVRCCFEQANGPAAGDWARWGFPQGRHRARL